MTERVGWAELPVELRRLVERETGTVTGSEEVPEGLNCSLALVLDTGSGPLFLKGARSSAAEEVSRLRREAQIGPTVSALGAAPAVRHRFEGEGWHCLAFDYVAGTHTDLTPGSADVAAVASVLRRLQDTPAPVELNLPVLADRFTGYLLPGEADALDGASLLHTDTNPHNFLTQDTADTAYLIDWAMPALGPAWVDVAYTAVRLMECGHSADEARAWLAGFSSWRDADPKAVEVFVNATCRHWTAAVGERGAEPSNRRFRSLLPS